VLYCSLPNGRGNQRALPGRETGGRASRCTMPLRAEPVRSTLNLPVRTAASSLFCSVYIVGNAPHCSCNRPPQSRNVAFNQRDGGMFAKVSALARLGFAGRRYCDLRISWSRNTLRPHVANSSKPTTSKTQKHAMFQTPHGQKGISH